MSSKNNPHKWGSFKNAYTDWWENLTIDQKVKMKEGFERLRIENEKSKSPYPDIYDLKHLRISQLADKHIYRIWVFRDRY